ncbi:extracellular solute-binding protein [Microbacterium schleiferi]|uniref:Extracellular solute-binding protein n=1 Tax=Microbacterium schleiferi TaxID=69362 RepID=A0A7S8MUQ8_9MICO|nr:extracellular solute-binding protein [Microbacterium schleiferi]QPE03459.1 extracellular solute-binding protein [Microbacterium schleiferi]
MTGKRIARVAPLVVVAVAGAALAGCSGQQSGGDDDEVGGELSIPSHLWESGPDAEYMTLLEDLTLEEYPGLTIDKPIVPFADYHQQVYTQMASGQAPDVVVPYDPQMNQWVQQDLLEPLNPWLEEAGVDVEAMIDAEQVAVVDGQVYGLLGFTNPRMFVYNQRLLEDAGVEPPTTPDEWRSVIEAVSDPANGVFGAAMVTGGASPVDIYQYLMPIVAGFGGAFVTDGEPTATDDEVVEALEFVKGLYDDGLLPVGQSSADVVDAFQAGKIATVVTGPFLVPASQDANPAAAADFTLSEAPFENPTVSVNVFFAMPKDAKNKDAAAAFIMNVVNQDLLDFTIEAKRVPPGVPIEVPQALLTEAPYLESVVAAAETAVSYSPGGVGDEATSVMNVIGDAFQAMLVNGTSAQDTAAAIQSELEALLAG